MDIFLSSETLKEVYWLSGISRHVLSLRSVPCKLDFPWKVCSQEAHWKLVDKKSTEFSNGTNGCSFINFIYTVPNQLAENLTQEERCVLYKVTFCYDSLQELLLEGGDDSSFTLSLWRTYYILQEQICVGQRWNVLSLFFSLLPEIKMIHKTYFFVVVRRISGIC